MRGETVRERARTREIIALVDEAMIHFGTAVHKGSLLFANMEEQHPTASAFGIEACKKQLGLLEGYYENWSVRRKEKVSVADCGFLPCYSLRGSFIGWIFVKD